MQPIRSHDQPVDSQETELGASGIYSSHPTRSASMASGRARSKPLAAALITTPS
jgi:hypothetical protein